MERASTNQPRAMRRSLPKDLIDGPPGCRVNRYNDKGTELRSPRSVPFFVRGSLYELRVARVSFTLHPAVESASIAEAAQSHSDVAIAKVG